MPIECACPCGRRLRVADEFAGKKARCPQCGAVVAVPPPAPDAGESEAPEDEPPVVRPRRKKKRRPADEEGPTARAYMREAEARLRRDDERERNRKREDGDGYTFGGVHVTAGVVMGGTLLAVGLVALAALLLARAGGNPASPRLYAAAAIGTVLGALTLVKALLFGVED